MAASAKVTEYGERKNSNGQQHQQTTWRGSAFYQSSSTSKISFLNNLGVFETEVDDDSGNIIQKVWEWK